MLLADSAYLIRHGGAQFECDYKVVTARWITRGKYFKNTFHQLSYENRIVHLSH